MNGCETFFKRLNLNQTEIIYNIYGSPSKKQSAVQVFVKIDKMSKLMIDNLPPGVAMIQDNNTFV